MAPMMDLPEIDMIALQKADILQSYLLLFQYMMEDFVHKEDLVAILSSNSLVGAANPPDYILKGIVAFKTPRIDVAAKSKRTIYSEAAKKGASIRAESLAALEAITS